MVMITTVGTKLLSLFQSKLAHGHLRDPLDQSFRRGCGRLPWLLGHWCLWSKMWQIRGSWELKIGTADRCTRFRAFGGCDGCLGTACPQFRRSYSHAGLDGYLRLPRDASLCGRLWRGMCRLLYLRWCGSLRCHCFGSAASPVSPLTCFAWGFGKLSLADSSPASRTSLQAAGRPARTPWQNSRPSSILRVRSRRYASTLETNTCVASKMIFATGFHSNLCEHPTASKGASLSSVDCNNLRQAAVKLSSSQHNASSTREHLEAKHRACSYVYWLAL